MELLTPSVGAFNTTRNEMARVQIRSTLGWIDVVPADVADLEDSIKNVNSDALSDPDEWGLAESVKLPAWARKKSAQK